MADKRGWTKDRIAYASQTLSARIARTDPDSVRNMTVELALANGAVVPYLKLFEYDVAARRTLGTSTILLPDDKLQAHFAAKVGKVYALWVDIEGHPTGTVKTMVYYPPMPPPGNPLGPLPVKGNLATDWPATQAPPFFVPVPSNGVIQ